MSHLLKFSVASRSKSAAKSEISVRGFRFLIDEPQALGGTNKAPNPVEYILAGYAGCINVIAHLVAKELGIILQDLSVDVQGDLNTDRIFGRSFDQRAGYQSIYVNIRTSTLISRNLQAKWLKSIEDRCPVNDNLSNTTPIIFHLSNN